MKTSLVIPAYNEKERLGPFLRSVTGYQNRHQDQISEVIIVNDGSKDTTEKVAQSFQAKIKNLRVITHKENRGKGAAVQTGVMAAHGDYIVFMDADGATPVSELPKMLHALQDHDVAVGNRWMPGARTERHSSLRRLSGFVYRQYMKLFGLGDIDTMCGFKGYRREVAHTLFGKLTEERWLFDTEIAFRALQEGYSIANFPIRWVSQDGSKLSTRTLLASAFKIWPLIRKLKKESRS